MTSLPHLALPTATIHPYSKLNELCQTGVISELIYVDEGFTLDKWRASVTVRAKTSQLVVGKAAALSKGMAKRLAAGHVVLQLSDETKLPHSPDSGYASNEDDYLTVPAAVERTSKQRDILRKAASQRSILQDMTRARGMHGGKTLFLSIDLEVYSHGSTQVLEVGLAWVYSDQVWGVPGTPPRISCQHLLVREFAHLKNDGEYDQRDNFLFGTSTWVDGDNMKSTVESLLGHAITPSVRVFLVGHTIQNDVDWLRSLGIDLYCMLPGLIQCDIGQAFQALRDDNCLTSLSRMMESYGLEHRCAHNGGNDAYYGIQASLKMMEEEGAEDMKCVEGLL